MLLTNGVASGRLLNLSKPGFVIYQMPVASTGTDSNQELLLLLPPESFQFSTTWRKEAPGTRI